MIETRFLDLVQIERLRINPTYGSTVYYEGNNKVLKSLEEYFELLNQLAVKSVRKSLSTSELVLPVKMSKIVIPNLSKFRINDCITYISPIFSNLFKVQICKSDDESILLANITVKLIERHI